jgi:hypothetical protein
VTFGLGNRCSILLSYGTKHAVDVATLHPTTMANARTRPSFAAEDCDRRRPTAL